MNGIGWAVKQMQDGMPVARAGWDGKGVFLFIEQNYGAAQQHPIGSSLVECELADVVWMKTADDKFVPWLCSQTDLLATDWEYASIP